MKTKNAEPQKANPAEKYQQIADYLQLKYSLRYNELRMVGEFYDEETQQFRELHEFHLNSWFVELKNQGFAVTDQVLKKVTASNLIPVVNPLKDYFLELPKWDGKDHIEALAKTITIEDSESSDVDVNALWKKSLRKFLISVVATAVSSKSGQLCLILTGSQGKGKSTWLSNLCPDSLKSNYLFQGGLTPKITEKATVEVLAEKLIVNLDDQLDGYTWREYEGMKSLITSTTLTSRKAYARNDANRPRRASIVASTNNPHFLVDTQNRRYLVFTAEHIDYHTKIDMDQVYAQALDLFRKGESYWLNSEEQEELNRMNSRYRMATMEEELVAQYLTPAEESDLDIKWLTTTEIKSKFEIHSSLKNLSLRLIGTSLRSAGFTRKNIKDEGKSHGVYKWGVITNI